MTDATGVFEDVVRTEQVANDKPSMQPLSNAQRHQILVEWNDTGMSYEDDRCIHEFIETQVERTPGATAIVFEHQRLSYRELNDRGNRLANYLRALGVGPGVLVAIYLDRCPDAVVAILATLKSGGAYIPIDASYPKERLAEIMADASTPVLVTHEALVLTSTVTASHVVCLDRDAATIASFSAANPVLLGSGSDTAFALFTSGSSGTPKGVLVMHRNLVNYRLLWEQECALSTSVSALCQTTFLSFAVFQGDVVRALCFGKTLVLCSREQLLAPQALYALMQRERTDFAEFVPALLRSLIGHLRESGEKLDFMRVLVVGADRWYLREHQEVRLHLGPATRFIHVYGSSETTLDSTRFEHSDLELSGDQPTPIGRPFTNVRAYVLDATLQPVGVGAEGELCIGGAGVTRGYLNRPELTAEKFLPDPFCATPGARLYRTGDLARWLPDGNIAFLGRGDQQVKIQGFRIELGEIEAALERQDSISSALVQAVETAPGTSLLVAYCVPSGPAPNEDDVRRQLLNKLPAFMVPSRFVMLAALPLTPSGKIDRRALPAPDAQRPTLANPFVAPHDELEQAVAEVWRQVLRLDQVGVDDQFFDLGGTSLLAAQVIGLLRAKLRLNLTLVQMFQHPTVATLARSLVQPEVRASFASQGRSRAEARLALSNRRRGPGDMPPG